MKNTLVATAAFVLSSAFIGTYSGQSLAQAPENTEQMVSEKQAIFEDLDDRYSYAYGAELAKKFKEEGVDLNPDMVATAMRDVFGGGEMRMPDGEIIATIEIYQEIHAKKKQAKRAAAGEKNKQDSAAFLAENASKKGVVVTDSGLQYKIITEGDGEYQPTEDDIVTVHYIGKFVDGTVFDSTYKRNEAYTAEVGPFIEGWSEALQMMSKGSKWELYIPADIAYGEEGSRQYVGPNAALIFEVTLLDIEKAQE